MPRSLSALLLLPVLGALAGALPVATAADPRTPEAPSQEARFLELVDRTFTLDQRADLRFLQHLGWTIVFDENASVISADGGRPGWRKDLQDAKADGDLVLRFPVNVARNQLAWFQQQLPIIADSQMSRLAYQLRVQAAVERATRKLADNTDRGRYVFPHILVFESLWFRCVPPHGWEQVPGEKTKHVAKGSSSTAIRNWYDQNAVGECYVAQWIGIYATRYELYGPEWFEEVFEPEDLVLGRPLELQDTTFGRYLRHDNQPRHYSLFIRPQDQGYDPGSVLAPLGPRAFAGLTGILQDPKGAPHSNENFMIVSVSERAAKQLQEIGGFTGIGKLTVEALENFNLARPLLVCGEQLFEYRRRMEEILSQPVFTEIQIYIHPYGVIPMRQIIEQKIYRKNVPLVLRQYSHAVEEVFFRQYHDAWKQRWMRTASPTPEPAATGTPPEGRGPATTRQVPTSDRVLPPVTPRSVPGVRDDLPPPKVYRKPPVQVR